MGCCRQHPTRVWCRCRPRTGLAWPGRSCVRQAALYKKRFRQEECLGKRCARPRATFAVAFAPRPPPSHKRRAYRGHPLCLNQHLMQRTRQLRTAERPGVFVGWRRPLMGPYARASAASAGIRSTKGEATLAQWRLSQLAVNGAVRRPADTSSIRRWRVRIYYSGKQRHVGEHNCSASVEPWRQPALRPVGRASRTKRPHAHA